MADLESPREDRVLLVEGQDDKHVVWHLCRRSQAMPSFHIKDKGGIDNLLASIGPEVKAPGRMAVGILPDANDNPGARWDALRYRLANRSAGKADSPSAALQARVQVDGGHEDGKTHTLNAASELAVFDGGPLHRRPIVRLEAARSQTSHDLFGDRDEHVEVHVHGRPGRRVVAERQRAADGAGEVLGVQGIREAPGKGGGVRSVGHFVLRQCARGAALRGGEATAARIPATASVHP